MAAGEFDLIRRYFAERTPRNGAVRLGIGDDCALLKNEPGHDWALTADTLVQGVHFLADCAPADLAYKALAVNLSDLAAMGAEPRAFTLALTLPEPNENWLDAFAEGLFALAAAHGVELCGGDTTKGPLVVIGIQAMGLVPQGQAIRRSGARPGDRVYLTGCLGDAGLGLKAARSEWQAPQALQRFNRPAPRVGAGLALRGLAHACIDVSDGLAADLGHLLAASQVGATLEWDHLPLSSEVAAYVEAVGDWSFPLGCGDDYELCFTAPGESETVLGRLAAVGCPCACIGRIEAQPGLRISRAGKTLLLPELGYRHF